MSINFDKALGIHEQALKVRQQRHDVLATNIANADTPGYKAQDIDFKAVLSESAASSQSQLALKTTNSGHMQVGQANADGLPIDLKYRVPTQPSVDGNTVDTHLEQAEFADNSVRYQATLQFLGSRFSGMKSVLQGGN